MYVHSTEMLLERTSLLAF